MFKTKMMTFLLVMSSVCMLLSCEPVQKLENSITIVPETVEAAYQGGTYAVRYKTTDDVRIEIQSVEADEEWISEFNTETEGLISFRVSENPSEEPRSALVSVRCAGNDTPAQFSVQQNAHIFPLEIVLSSVKKSYVTFSILSKDPDMGYICFMSDADKMGDEVTDEQIFEEDMLFIKNQSVAQEIPLEEILSYYITYGDLKDKTAHNLTPDSEYVIYVYGVRWEGEEVERLTEVLRVPVRTQKLEMIDAQFSVDVKVDAAEAVITYTPLNHDGYYIGEVYMTEADFTEDEILESIRQNWKVMLSIFYTAGYTPDEILEEIARKGEVTTDYSMMAGNKYVAVAFAVDDECLICSDIEPVFFEPGEIAHSDISIEIELWDITATSVMARFTPSNDDPYTATICTVEEVDGMSDEEILDYLMEYGLETVNGVQEIEIGELYPSTEFLICAFGYSGGVCTSEIFYEIFETAAESGISPRTDYRISRPLFTPENVVPAALTYDFLPERHQGQ